jgi:hypothetical protein
VILVGVQENKSNHTCNCPSSSFSFGLILLRISSSESPISRSENASLSSLESSIISDTCCVFAVDSVSECDNGEATSFVTVDVSPEVSVKFDLGEMFF